MFKTGTVNLPQATAAIAGGWDLETGTGIRTYLSPDIPFVEPWLIGTSPAFSGPPLVVLSLTGIVVFGGLAQVELTVENVQAEEFNIRVVAFENCMLNRVQVTWFAYDTA